MSKTANTVIRPATAADFPVLLEIDTASFPRETAYDSDELSYYMNRRSAETLVLEREGEIEAFIIVDIDRRSRASTIITLDVRDRSRRLGFGSQLMQRSEEIATERDAKECRLQVDVNNAGAIEFYEKHGYKATRRLSQYYPDGHDAWLMIKALRRIGGTSLPIPPIAPGTPRGSS